LREFSSAKTAYISKKQELEAVSQFIADALHMCKDRVQLWNQLLRLVERKMRQLFDKCMANKGHSGRLIFDHVAQTLDIEVG
jgi:hypothetical protein